GDAGIVGKTVRVNKHPYTVIGVAPAGFQGTEKMFWPEVWLPILNEGEIEGYRWIDARNDQNAWLVGRLKDGVSVTQAEANLNNISAQLASEHPATDEHIEYRLSRP